MKFIEIYERNYWGKPKDRTSKSLIQKKSRIIEPSGKLLFLFSQIRRPEVKRLSLMKQAKKHICDGKKIRKIFNDFFSNVVSDLKIPDFCNYFPHKKTHILSRLSLKLSKNTPVFSIFKKGNLIQYFHSETLLKRRYWMLSRA